MTRETAVKAIEAWRANPATTFTPANILREFGDDILTALRDPAPCTWEPEPNAVREALERARDKLIEQLGAGRYRANFAFIDAALSAPVAGTWPKPIAEAPRNADEILLVSFQEQEPNGLVYVSLNNGCWDEAQKCFVLGPRGCSTNAVGDGHSTHWLPRSWLPDVAATRNDRGSEA